MANAVEIGGYAIGAGVRDPRALASAIAIALAESGGNPRAHNPRPPDDSYGLWQINMLGDLGPSRRAQLGIASNDALYDPATNARAMYVISGGGTNWRPWSTYNGARYLVLLPVATAAATAALAKAGAGAAGDAAQDAVVNPITDAAAAARQALGLADAAHAWVTDRHNWARVAFVLVGSAMAVGGLIAVAGPSVSKATAPVTRAIGAIK